MSATPQHAYDRADAASPARAAPGKVDVRLANEAWESLFRAQVLLMRRFAADETWADLSQNEYDVLYTLAKAPGGLNMSDVNCQTLLTQGGVSKLISRLEQRGLVSRCVDPVDRRAALVTLTDEEREMQRLVGRRHARTVAAVMHRVLSDEQMEQVLALGAQVASRILDADETLLQHTSDPNK